MFLNGSYSDVGQVPQCSDDLAANPSLVARNGLVFSSMRPVMRLHGQALVVLPRPGASLIIGSRTPGPFRVKASNKSDVIKAINDNNSLHLSGVDDQAIGFFRGALFGLLFSSIVYALVILAFTAALSNGANAASSGVAGSHPADIGPDNVTDLDPVRFYGLSANSFAVGSFQHIGIGDKPKVLGGKQVF